MNSSKNALIERVLGTQPLAPLATRVEIRRVLNRHRGSKTVVALSVRPRPVTVQAVSQWLAGHSASRRIWEAAHAIAEHLKRNELQSKGAARRLPAHEGACNGQQTGAAADCQ